MINKTQKQPTAVQQHTSEIESEPGFTFSIDGFFSFQNVLTVIVFARAISAFLNPISDCDEVFNYWEPTHQVLFGFGFQTWEYSPVYALRSYLYVLIHALFGKLLLLVGIGKLPSFFMLRVILGLFCSICETYFHWGVARRFGKRIALLTICFLTFSSGMFNASTAYLPSSFSMYFLMVAIGSWYLKPYHSSNSLIVIGATAIAVIVGWPFCIVAVVPMAFDVIYRLGFWRALKMAVISAVLLLGATVAADYYFYHRFFVTPLNLMLYNSAASGVGSALYGVEPWTFYFKNLILNFNVVFVLGLFAPIVILIHHLFVRRYFTTKPTLSPATETFRRLLFVSPFQIWFWFMTSLPHKEERFLFLVYPVLCVSAAVALDYKLQCFDVCIAFIGRMFSRKQTTSATNSNRSSQSEPASSSSKTSTSSASATLTQRRTTQTTTAATATATATTATATTRHLTWPKLSSVSILIAAVICLLFVALSISRSASIVINYNAPFMTYANLSQKLRTDAKQELVNDQPTRATVCVGKEWYRFPSSFFLPFNTTRLAFLKSSFSGLLPKYFEDNTPFPTAVIPTTMNNLNREEFDRYVDVSQCDYIVDFDFEGQEEERYINTLIANNTVSSGSDTADRVEWIVLTDMPFLDAAKSPMWTRAFYIPRVSEKHNVYGRYYVLQKTVHRTEAESIVTIE